MTLLRIPRLQAQGPMLAEDTAREEEPCEYGTFFNADPPAFAAHGAAAALLGLLRRSSRKLRV